MAEFQAAMGSTHTLTEVFIRGAVSGVGGADLG